MMIRNLINHIIIEGVILAEWGLSIFVKCYKAEGDAFNRGNYMGPKLPDQDLKRVKGHFIPRRGTEDVIFSSRPLQEKYSAKKTCNSHLLIRKKLLTKFLLMLFG